MKKINFKQLALVAATAASLGFAAPSYAEGMKVAIIAPSASNDLAFTQSIVDAVNTLKDEYELEVAITDGTFIVDDAAAAIRSYAKEGYDLVIAHG